MLKFRSMSLVFAASLLLTASSGCGRVLHELNPARLQQWNRGPNLYNDEVMFSVSDSLDAPEPSLERLAMEPSQIDGKSSGSQHSSP